MGIQVFLGIPECTNPPCWGGACGQYYGFDVTVYDTSRPRPNGSTNPWSNLYMYYPAEGAKIFAKFYTMDGSWSKLVTKMIPTRQPVSEDIASVNVGTVMPCNLCENKEYYIVGCSVKVIYKSYRWYKDLPNLLKIDCPPPPGKTSPSYFGIESTEVTIYGNTACTEMRLTESEVPSFEIPVALYMSGVGEQYHAVRFTKVMLHKDKLTKVCFDIPEITNIPEIDLSVRRYVAIAPNKDITVSKDWACAKKWEWGF